MCHQEGGILMKAALLDQTSATQTCKVGHRFIIYFLFLFFLCSQVNIL